MPNSVYYYPSRDNPSDPPVYFSTDVTWEDERQSDFTEGERRDSRLQSLKYYTLEDMVYQLNEYGLSLDDSPADPGLYFSRNVEYLSVSD
jgi:hypothetical protein